MHQIVGTAKIQFSKNSPLQQLKGSGHKRQEILIMNHDLLEAPIINTQPKASTFFDTKKASTSRSESLDASCQGLLNVSIHCSLLMRR